MLEPHLIASTKSPLIPIEQMSASFKPSYIAVLPLSYTSLPGPKAFSCLALIDIADVPALGIDICLSRGDPYIIAAASLVLSLNTGLALATTDYIVTVDADTSLHKEAIAHLVTNITEGPIGTAAVAGNILVRNSRDSLMSRMQEWEYFLSISASKRSQSLLQGTLCAQGAISVFDTEAVREMGGWNVDAVGEDIVLTWGLQLKGYRVAYSEKAIAFTNVPTKYSQFFKQRERWARGLIEAFKIYPGVIFRLKLTSPFIWANVLLPLVDTVFLFAFMPGLIAAIFFGWYGIASMMTLTVVPLIILLTFVMHIQHRRIFDGMGLMVRRNFVGLVFWAFTYMFWMCPATVSGYIKEVFKIGKKDWGTK